MKKETAEKLQELSQSGRIKFNSVPEGLELLHDLDDEEIREVVELEYGQTLQSVVDLFKCILKEAVKLAMKEAKNEKSQS